MIPDDLHIGPVPIHIFGIFVALGFIAAGWATSRELGRKGYPSGEAWNLITWAAVGGLGGARLWSMVSEWRDLFDDPMGTLFGAGGLVWYGGLVGGTIAVSIFLKSTGIPWLRGADATAPGLALGHAIGRIGCQLAGDGDWGSETEVPWGMAYPHAVVGWDYPPDVRVHPTPIYEFAAYFAIFLFLWTRRSRPAADGTAFGIYLVLAGIARFAVEFVRINPRVVLGLSLAQLMSLALVGVGMWLLVRARHGVAGVAPDMSVRRHP